MSRGRLILLSQRTAAQWRMPHAGDPPKFLSAPEALVWNEIKRAMPIPPRRSDEMWLELTARVVHRIRAHPYTLEDLRLAYRCLGHGFVPMPERRRLLFGAATRLQHASGLQGRAAPSGESAR